MTIREISGMKLFIVMILIQFLYSVTPAPYSRPEKRNNKLAVTIDDLPFTSLNGKNNERAEYIINGLIENLNKFNAPATGFVNENKLYNNGSPDRLRINILTKWIEAGYNLGNHTYSHPDINSTPLEEYFADILKGEKITRQLLGEHKKELKYFRHPFLHTGYNEFIKKNLSDFLSENNYTVAPVTIDNSEWIFARAYDRAETSGDIALLDKIAEDYINYMREKTGYYESQSIQLFDYNINHVLLIHANKLNADHLDELLKMFVEEGYEFISLEEALSDPAYNSADEYTGRAGISWLHRWALSADRNKTFFEGEPLTPQYIMNAAGIQSE